MILSDLEIWMEIGSARLRFTPSISPRQVTSSSVDLRLANEFTTLRPTPPGVEILIDSAMVSNVEDAISPYGERRTIPNGESLILRPGDFVLAYTLESIEMPNYLAARVEGRSLLARLGISIHQTAPTVHATFAGQLRLEISHQGPYPCRLYPEQKICQLVIERLGTPSQTILRSSFQHQQQTST